MECYHWRWSVFFMIMVLLLVDQSKGQQMWCADTPAAFTRSAIIGGEFGIRCCYTGFSGSNCNPPSNFDYEWQCQQIFPIGPASGCNCVGSCTGNVTEEGACIGACSCPGVPECQPTPPPTPAPTKAPTAPTKAPTKALQWALQ